MFRQLFDACKWLIAAAYTAAGTTTVTGATIDTLGFDSVAFVAQLGAVTSTGVPAIKIQHGDASDGSDMADVAGTAVTGDDTYSNKCLGTEIHRPTKRYVRAVVTRTTANVVLHAVSCVLFNAHSTPVTQTDLALSESAVSPASGTA